MAHQNPRGDRAVVKLPHKPMSTPLALFCDEAAITLWILPASPKPAFIGDCDRHVGPKTLFY